MSLLKEASLAYIFDPIRNTFVDDEDKSLGNKLALNDDEFQKLLDTPGVFRASEAPQPPPRPDVQDIEAINRFMRDNPVNKAEGGRINQQSGTNIMTLNPLFPEKDPTDFDSFKPLDVPGMAFPVGATIGGMRLKDTFFSKDKDDDKKEIISSDDKTPGTEPPEDPLEKLITLTKAKDVFDTIDRLYNTGRSNEIPQYRTKEFANNIKNLVDNKYGGNISKLASDLDIERVRINSLFKKYGIKPLREGNKTMQTIFLEQDQDKLFLKDLTDEMKYDEQYLIDRIKKRYPNYEQDKKKFFNFKDLAEMSGMTFRTDDVKKLKTDQDDFLTRLRKTNQKFNLKTQPGFGKETKYQLKDFVEKFTKYNLSKPVAGTGSYQVKIRKNFLKEQDPSLIKVKDNVTQNVRKITKNVLGDNFTQYALEQIGHGVSVNNQISYKKLFKNSNVGIATEVLQDPVLNIQVLSGKNSTKKGYENRERKFYSILEDLVGKKATNENIKIATDALDGLNKLRSEAADDSRLKTNFLKDQSNRIPRFELNLPEIGKKFKSGFLNVDMSGIDPSVSVGRILEINPNAKSLADLSEEEQKLYEENLKQQLADYAQYFYTEKGLDKDDVDDLYEALMEDNSIKIEKASGGGVEITPLPRLNFSEGGTDNFAAELEYYLTNPDAELPKMQTFEETLNPIVMINDMIDPRNYPYYADQLVQGGIRVGEFATRILPATGKLISDLVRKPAFKITGASGQGYVQDYDELPQGANLKGTGIFSEFLENITPTATEKKLGLDKLIEAEEQKMKDRGSTIAPKVLGETLSLGIEFGSPIFPGIKLLKAYANANKLPVDNVTKELLEKEVDKVLTERGTSRRKFLQTAGAGASLMLAKMLGFGDDFAKTAKVAEKAVAETATGSGVPPYFFQLVEKIKKNGTKFEAEFDPRVENNMYFENFALRENLSTGEMSITKVNEGGVNTGEDIVDGIFSEETITYNPGETIIGKDGKPIKTGPEYEEYTTKPDMDGKMKDTEPGLDSIEQIINLLGPNKLKMSELEAAGYNVNAFPDNIKNLLINDLQKTN